MEQLDTDTADWPTPPGTREDLLHPLARLIAMLDLPNDTDTQLLKELIRAHPDGDLVLTPAQEDAYQHLAARINLVQSDADVTTRFLY